MVNNLDLPYTQSPRILEEEELKPYKIEIHISHYSTLVTIIYVCPVDELKRLEFCQWFFSDPYFSPKNYIQYCVTIMTLAVYIALFGWYLMIFEVSAEQSALTSLLDKFKQHDYKLKFERGELVRIDKRYMKFTNIVTFKYNRTCPLVNASQMYNLDVGNNLEVVIQTYRFASNEYRIFPMRFQVNFCDTLKNNVMGLGDFRKCGTFHGCPVLKGRNYSICNWAPNPAMFPPFIPDGQYMMEFQAMYDSMELFAFHGYATVSRPIPGSE